MTDVCYLKDHVSFFASYRSPQRHSHFAKHLIFSQGGAFDCIVNNDRFQCTGVCIDSSAEHTIQNERGSIFVMLVEETSELSQILYNLYLRGRPYAVIKGDILGDIQDIHEADTKMLEVCAPDVRTASKYDGWIADVLREIESSESIDDDMVERLCSVACLSQSRLSHLFRKQVRISLASYLVIAKMKKVLIYLMNGENITEASIHAGFSSSSHYAATCKRMFGISCSDFAK
jgi:AraC-like DNA-binding protein